MKFFKLFSLVTIFIATTTLAANKTSSAVVIKTNSITASACNIPATTIIAPNTEKPCQNFTLVVSTTNIPWLTDRITEGTIFASENGKLPDLNAIKEKLEQDLQNQLNQRLEAVKEVNNENLIKYQFNGTISATAQKFGNVIQIRTGFFDNKEQQTANDLEWSYKHVDITTQDDIYFYDLFNKEPEKLAPLLAPILKSLKQVDDSEIDDFFEENASLASNVLYFFDDKGLTIQLSNYTFYKVTISYKALKPLIKKYYLKQFLGFKK